MTTWAARVKDLQDAGMTLGEISDHTGLAVSSLSDIGNGRTQSPGGDAAILLHELHLDRCGRAPAKRRKR